MYLDAAFPPIATSGDAAVAGRHDDLRLQLWDRVRATFPAMAGSRARLEEGGGDHLLLIVEERRAFRFPRAGRHGLGLEIEVLRRLRPQAGIAVPDYDLVDPAGGFAGYKLIPGTPLTVSRYRRLPLAARATVLDAAVDLLARLHGLDPQAIERLAAWPRMWPARRFADRLSNDRLPLLADRAPTLAGPIDLFLRHHRNDEAPDEVVLHGDLVGDHLLIDEQAGRMTGVIDFGDVALGDPAHDLMGFWAYGADAAAVAIGRYGRTGSDPALPARSRHHYVRHRLDRLYDAIVEDAPAGAIERQVASLALLLAETLG